MRQASPHDALLEEFRHLKLDGTDTAELAHAIRLLGAMVELLHPPEYERPVAHPLTTTGVVQAGPPIQVVESGQP